MPNIVIDPHSKQGGRQPKRTAKNVFSDETNLALIRLLRGKNALSEPTEIAGIAIRRDLQLELAAAIRERILPWFWSFCLHFAILLILALVFLPTIQFKPIDVLSGFANIPTVPELPILNPIGDAAEKVPEQLPAEKIEEHVTKPEPQDTSPLLNFSGRDLNSRTAQLAQGGGSGQTDEAVLAGLRWLVRVQQPSGAWNFSGKNFPQAAPKSREDAAAATAMALIAFQGYGITPDSPHPQSREFHRSVQMGWNWLLRQQNLDGGFFAIGSASDPHRFYTHGLCTIAICELLAMTGDETLREPAQRAVDYCIQHQSVERGGWRYQADRFSPQSDVSVTGWIVIALKSGQAAGLTVPPSAYVNVTKFLDSMEKENQYQYREEEPEPRISMTAEALLCRILLGWKQENPRLAAGVQTILNSPPSFDDHYRRDVYYWFFATQTLYHCGGNAWQTWNSTLRGQLLKHQENAGTESGSWNPNRPVRDAWGVQYGRLYTTCFSLYILEVYYRHQRIY